MNIVFGISMVLLADILALQVTYNLRIYRQLYKKKILTLFTPPLCYISYYNFIVFVSQIEAANFRCGHDYADLSPLSIHPSSSHFGHDPAAEFAARILEPFTSTFTPHRHDKGSYNLLQLLPFPVAPLNIAQPLMPLQPTLSHPSLLGPLFSLF